MLDQFLIGYAENETNTTGVTVVLSEEGATTGCCVKGAAPATREVELLKTENSVQKINAVVLSGSSAFGLSAACGVMQYLHEKNLGFKASGCNIPIVSGASIFDLPFVKGAFVDAQLGYKACQNAKASNFKNGRVGAGAGATVGKILGGEFCQSSGIGFSTGVFENGLEIAAITVVNALGDVVDQQGNVVKGLCIDGKHANSAEMLINENNLKENLAFLNTTLTVILTNALLSKLESNKIAARAHDAFARAIVPVHTDYDGDAIFIMSDGQVECDLTSLQVMVNLSVEASIRNAVL